MNRLTALTAAALFAAGTGAAFAQATTATDPTANSRPAHAAAHEQAFKKADKNSDGKLSKEEAGAVKGWADKFDGMDADKDGFVTLTEYTNAMAAAGPGNSMKSK